jgi:C-terminal processing protease CtpA/Prc
MKGSALLPGDIGYLRISAMRDWQAGEIDRWMNHFRDADGLIVDVRGNGGGSRDALRALFPYLMGEDDRPWVMNIGKFRLHEDREPHHMTRRFMYAADSVHWAAAERESIDEFMASWQPEWVPPAGKFSVWHFMVMSRRINPGSYHFDRPVVVLLDYSCFSATDIFVSAFKGWPNVTLVGTPSGGGSALSETFVLSNSHLRIRHASMASFQRSGRLHDGNGTKPDIRVEPDPEFFLKHGRDNQLDLALELLIGGEKSTTAEGSN